jgi:hypothetical protein
MKECLTISSPFVLHRYCTKVKQLFQGLGVNFTAVELDQIGIMPTFSAVPINFAWHHRLRLSLTFLVLGSLSSSRWQRDSGRAEADHRRHHRPARVHQQ